MAAVLFAWQSLWAQDAPPPGGQGGGLAYMMPAFVLIFVFFYFMILRPQRREQDARKQMIDNLKKNDHVVTVGGIYGVVTNVRRDSDEVTLKVDEGTNAKLRVTIASISRVILPDDQPSKADSK